MKFDLDSLAVAELLAGAGGCKLTENEGTYHLVPRRPIVAGNLTISADEIERLIKKIQDKEVSDDTVLYNDFSYEVAVREEAPIPFRRFREEKIEVRDEEGKLTYELSQGSDEYLVWFLARISQEGAIRDWLIPPPPTGRVLEPDRRLSALDFLRLTAARFLTLKVCAETKTPLRQLVRLTHSFLFQLGYNLDMAFVPYKSLEEMSRRSRITRMRRRRTEEIDPPRRLYPEELIHHYLLSVSTDNPVIGFLSYYHILEHFFEAVFNDELIENVRKELTHPGFSYKRKKDIDQLIKLVRRSIQIRSDTVTFSESEALRLCLKRFVNIAELIAKLNEYDPKLVVYYRDNKVTFSDGIAVNLQASDTEEILKQLSRRIYATRNALVHSKNSDVSKYTPFVDERVLIKEVPLMRFIAEMVILSESTVL
jgi:hypothetical protein